MLRSTLLRLRSLAISGQGLVGLACLAIGLFLTAGLGVSLIVVGVVLLGAAAVHGWVAG